MNNLFLWIFLLTLLQSILFYGKSLGLSVVIFMIFLLPFLYYVLKKNNKIKNKYGFIFIIPILLLSVTYLLYDNWVFKTGNFIVIFTLFIFMYIYTIQPTWKLSKLIHDFFRVIFEPFSCISRVFRILGFHLSKKLHLSPKVRKILKSVFWILPIVMIILLLLTSADMIFEKMFSTIFEQMGKLFDFNEDIFGRIIMMIIFFTYLSATMNFIIFNYKKQEEIEIKKKEKDPFTIKLLLTILNIIYIVFDFIQIKSLMLHQVGTSITYAEYARQGFFQLMFVSIINVSLILISKKYDKEGKSFLKIMSLVMLFLTFIIIISSFMRMHLYESEYGYTLLRFLVYTILFTESILFIPTTVYILNPTFKILKYYMEIILTVYIALNFMNVDAFIANKNIDRYKKTGKIDINYLENYNSDNIPLLVSLYHNDKDEKIRKSLEMYFKYFDISMDSIPEYNLSKMKAKRLLKK